MALLLDGCRFNPTAGGTTDWTYSSAVTGYQSPTAANAVNGAAYRYRAESADLSQWEIGLGTYNSGTGTFSRSVVMFNSAGTTAKINFTAVPQVAIVALAEDLPVARGHIYGLTFSTAGSSATFSIAAGQAADGTGVDMLTLAGALSKTTGAWSAGNAGGALDAGTGALVASAWYWLFLIKRPDTGAVDVIATKGTAGGDPAPVTLPTGYTLWRYIWSAKTDSSGNWVLSYQIGDDCLWAQPQNNVNETALGTTVKTYTFADVPPGVRVIAICRGHINDAAVGAEIKVMSMNENATAVDDVFGNRTQEISVSSIGIGFGELRIRMNRSQQMQAVSSQPGNTTVFRLVPMGYTDPRGRYF